jgi:hypothetical protein
VPRYKLEGEMLWMTLKTRLESFHFVLLGTEMKLRSPQHSWLTIASKGTHWTTLL